MILCVEVWMHAFYKRLSEHLKFQLRKQSLDNLSHITLQIQINIPNINEYMR